MFDIAEELKLVPKLPGVYMMENELGEIIYVGKAKVLKNRLSQYFQSQKNRDLKVQVMIENIDRFEYIITDTEVEALILEANLIKQHKPKYNILLRDDKQYPFIVIDRKDKYPRVEKTRKRLKDKAHYFGPYTDVSAVNTVMDIIGEYYKLRTCKLNLNHGPKLKRPCLNYHIGKCLGPCFKEIDDRIYNDMVEEVIMYLEGKTEVLIDDMKIKMEEASRKMEYEEAAIYRDRIQALKTIREKQKIVYDERLDRDIIAMARGTGEACIQIFHIRNGKITGREDYMLDNTDGLTKSDIISSFIRQFYITASHVPREILAEVGFEDRQLVEEWLRYRRGSAVDIKVPQKGSKLELINMVKTNAFESLKKNQTRVKSLKNSKEEVLEELRQLLDLRDIPKRIEAYDISNTQGINSVGSMVVFQDGRPSRQDYRKFKIKYVTGPDDYSSLEEVLDRRFRRGLEELKEARDKSLLVENFSAFPDIIMMDGGKGQVGVANRVLSKLGFEIPVCGMVKDDSHNTRGFIYKNREIDLKKDRKLLRFISAIQDEAHRFAIGYHRELMNKQMIKSELDGIEGIGPVRKKSLLSKFGSVEKIKLAQIEEILEVEGINRTVAEKVYGHFRRGRREV